MGGKSSSSSAQNTTNQDNRIAVQDGVGVGAGGSFFAQDNSRTSTSTFINTLDGGAIKDAFSFASNTSKDALGFAGTANKDALGFGSRALQTVEMSNAAVGEGFSQLLDAAEGLFNRGESMIGQTQQAVTDAYRNAQTDAKGTIDNRTITVLAVAGVAALFLLNRGK